jgi:2-polyprenyl-3-methyl-5-hydroxy-6-metoxy-1,4-benzoquinol methylase
MSVPSRTESERQRLDAIAENFSMRDGFNGYMTKYRVTTILENCPGRTVLDFASADCYMAESLHPFYERIVCVDGSRELIDRARQRLAGVDNVEYACSLIEDFDVDEKFDVVLLSFILEHVINPVDVIRKAARSCKPGGCLFIMVPNAESLHRRVGQKMGVLGALTDLNETDHKQGHRRVYTVATLLADIAGGGLQVETHGTFMLKPLSNAQMDGLDRTIADAFFEVGRQLPGWGSSIYAKIVPQPLAQ